MLRLMQPTPTLPSDHPLLAHRFSESDKWTTLETEKFHKFLLKHDKDFYSIAQEVSFLDRLVEYSGRFMNNLCTGRNF